MRTKDLFKLLFSSSLVMSYLFQTTNAYAYIGPGAGIALLGALWGFIVVIALAIVGILLWPLRSILRNLRQRRDYKLLDEHKADK